MAVLIFLSEIAVPLVMVAIIAYGYLNRIDIYSAFIEGAAEGLQTVVGILPTLVGLMVAVGILSGSGALRAFSDFIAPLTSLVQFPTEAVPLVFMRLVSSSASAGLILDIFKNFGPDSFLGRYVSIMMSCTETVFYTMAVYFMSVKITKTKHTLFCALVANFAGVLIALFVTMAVFGR